MQVEKVQRASDCVEIAGLFVCGSGAVGHVAAPRFAENRGIPQVTGISGPHLRVGSVSAKKTALSNRGVPSHPALWPPAVPSSTPVTESCCCQALSLSLVLPSSHSSSLTLARPLSPSFAVGLSSWPSETRHSAEEEPLQRSGNLSRQLNDEANWALILLIKDTSNPDTTFKLLSLSSVFNHKRLSLSILSNLPYHAVMYFNTC